MTDSNGSSASRRARGQLAGPLHTFVESAP